MFHLSPTTALFVYSVGIAGLFWLNRDQSAHTSRALWLPVVWFWIIASRPVSVWLGINSDIPTAASYNQGSPLDATIFGLLILFGLIVVFRRKEQVKSVLGCAWPVVLYFAYCLASVSWSDFPDISLKRWIKSLGDIVMALIVATEVDLLSAAKRFFSRVGFILIPYSLLLLKYFPLIGRWLDPASWVVEYCGVAEDKNGLGAITFLLIVGVLWQVFMLLGDKQRPHRRRQLFAQLVLLSFGIWLLVLAHSATSIACSIVAGVIMLFCALPFFRARPRAVHALVLLLLIAGGFLLMFGGVATVNHALGRKSNFTGRTAIWSYVIPMNPNFLLGAGFESFWLGPRLKNIWIRFAPLRINEAHNGYIEMYIQLGWLGVFLLSLLILMAYKRAVSAFHFQPWLGVLTLPFIPALALYSITEASFRMLGVTWFLLLLAMVVASRVVSDGLAAHAPQPIRVPVWGSKPQPVAGARGWHDAV